MKQFILAMIPWIGMALLIGIGMVMCVNGSPWLLILSVLGFIVAVGKIGCATH